jgi:hypothetical protein
MRFYVLKDPPSDSAADKEAGTEAVRSEGYTPGEALRCPACGGFVSMLRWLAPHEAELETWGKSFGDLVYKGYDEILVSERFKSLYERSGLSGLSTFDPVKIVKVIRRRKLIGDPPRYHRADIARSRAAIDQKSSGFVWEEPPTCPECRSGNGIKRWSRVVIEENTWSGEDVFQPRGLAVILVTERFKEFCELNNIKNAYFVPAEEYGHDFYPRESESVRLQ